MLKKTYSPEETMFKSSAANIISRTVVGFAQTTTTATKVVVGMTLLTVLYISFFRFRRLEFVVFFYLLLYDDDIPHYK